MLARLVFVVGHCAMKFLGHIELVTEWGLDAVEGYYSLFGPNETALVKELAAIYGAAISGGSDYHGGNSTVALGTGAGGLRVPAELLTELKRRRTVSN